MFSTTFVNNIYGKDYPVPDCSTGTEMIMPAYPLSTPMLFHHKINAYMLVPNFHCKELS